jgi:zinc protease
MRRVLFGNSGYGLDSLGSETSLPGIRRADLRAFHQHLAVPNNCVLAVFGDVQTARVLATVKRAFAGWKRGTDLTAISSSKFQIADAPKRVTESRDKKQAVLVIGWPGITLRDNHRFALELLQETCSDLGSRLFLRVREKLGLAYYVGAQNFMGLAPGCFSFYAGTEPNKADAVEVELLAEAELLRREGVTAAELQRAKAKLLGQKKIARQDLGDLALQVALDELYGLGFGNFDAEDAHLEAVTLADVRAAAAEYLRPNRFVVALLKPDSDTAQ